MEIFLSFGLVTIETYCFMKLAKAYFRLNYSENKTSLIIVLFSNIVNILVFPAITVSGSRIEKTFLAITFFFVILIIFYEGFWIKKFFLAGIFYLLIYAVDYLGTYIVLFFSDVSLQEIYESKIGFIILSCFSKSMLFFICMIWTKKYENARENNQLSFIEWCQLLVIPICMILNLSIVVYESIKNNTLSAILLLDIILLILSTFSYIFLEEKTENRKKIEIENIILKNKMKEKMVQAEIIKKNFESQRSMTHDFQNHLCVLQSLISKNANEDAMKLLNQLTMETKENVQILRTGNNFIDAILNFKYTSCSKENIWMIFEINNLSNLSLPTDKIIVILSNLLDNAIEACLELESERYIKIKFLVEKDIMLSIKNTTNRNLISKDNMMTIKENKILHGYGLKNIERAVKETGGISTVNCKDGWFQYTILWTCC